MPKKFKISLLASIIISLYCVNMSKIIDSEAKNTFFILVPMSLIISLTVCSIAISEHFKSRIILYEFMSGNSSGIITISKLVFYSLLVTVIYTIPVSIYSLICCNMTSPMLTLSLLFIIAIRLTVFSVCIGFIFQANAMFVPLIRLIIEIFPIVAASSAKEKSDTVFNYFPLSQCIMLVTEKPSSLAMNVIISFVIEAVIMFLLMRLSIEKRLNISKI